MLYKMRHESHRLGKAPNEENYAGMIGQLRLGPAAQRRLWFEPGVQTPGTSREFTRSRVAAARRERSVLDSTTQIVKNGHFVAKRNTLTHHLGGVMHLSTNSLSSPDRKSTRLNS